MGFQADIADALLETIKTCVDCERYDRQLVSLGDPSIECSTLAVSLQSFPPIAQVAECAVYELRLNVVLALCCVPVGGSDGSAPSAVELTGISRCVSDDVEALLCCLQNLSIVIPGAVKQCRPKVYDVRYERPRGGCVAARIELRLPGVPCCAP